MLVPKSAFLQKHNIQRIIRFHPEDFSAITPDMKKLTHFNLQQTSHQPAETCALVKIVRRGYFRDGEEVLPLLSFEGCFIAQCLVVRNNIAYAQLTPEDFNNSLPQIRTVGELKDAIVRRYSQSMPALSSQEILDLGVGITKLEITGRWVT